MNNIENTKPKKFNKSLFISILSFAVSFSTLIYTIYKDNAESISLWCIDASCSFEYPVIDDDFIITGTYIISNNSHQKVSIIDAYVTYKDERIDSNLDDVTLFPINIDANTSYSLSVGPIKSYYYLEAYYFEVHVITSTQKEYSVRSTYYLD